MESNLEILEKTSTKKITRWILKKKGHFDIEVRYKDEKYQYLRYTDHYGQSWWNDIDLPEKTIKEQIKKYCPDIEVEPTVTSG